jgi:CP family cyanate transporter-like MFS transporter
MTTTNAAAGGAMREFWIATGLLWLAGVSLRLTVLAVPPVIPLIQADLRLSGTEIGILSGLPVILFGVAALPGSLLIARFGALQTLVAGLLVAGVASGLRGVLLDVFALYAATILMSAAIAVIQPALPPLIREWLPQRMGFGTAVCTNGLLVGETLGVMLTIPVVLPLVGDSWRWGFVIWGVPLAVTAALAAVLAPVPKKAVPGAPAPRWWPDWSNKLIWRIGIVFGSVNSVYFSTNAFLPGLLTGAGRPDLIQGALTALNFGQLPASFLLLALAGRLERRAWPLVLCGALILLCLGGIVTTASGWTVLFAGMLGFLGACVFTLAFGLPALLSAPADVARMSAAMFTISYCEGLLVSVLSGAAWDFAGTPRFAFLPIAIAAVPLLFVPAAMQLRRPQAPTTS